MGRLYRIDKFYLTTYVTGKKNHPLPGGLSLLLVARYNSTLKNHNSGGIKSLLRQMGQSTQSLY
jgi:hypothetical protein